MKRRGGGVEGSRREVLGMRGYIKMGCVPGESVPGGNLNKLITAIGFLFFFSRLLSSGRTLSSNWALPLCGAPIGREGM